MNSRIAVNIAISTTLTISATLIVLARVWTRCIIIHQVGRDEVAICLAMLASITMFIAIMLEYKFGLGKNIWDIPPRDLERQLLCLWISILGYIFSLTLTKAAIVLQYWRVFVTPRMRLACKFAFGLVAMYFIITVPMAIFMCYPVSALWTGKGVCWSKTWTWVVNVILNITTDLVILIVPMPVLSTLQLPKKQKIGLMCIFALGGFVTIVSFVRINGLIITGNSKNITYDNVRSAIWSLTEVNLAIICACLPTLKPLINKIFPRLLTTSHQTMTEIPTSYRGASLSSHKLQDLPQAVHVSNRSAISETV